jgi:uncharacterized DUF497 family protein
MEFEWDENKNLINIEKHSIDFSDIISAFDLPIVIKEDSRKNYGEQRFIALGQVQDIIFVIVFTIRKNRTRIISARKANKTEREIYYEQS